LPLIGLGEVRMNEKRMSGGELTAPKGWSPIELQSKEGLALLNGTQFMGAYGIWILLQTHRLSKQADLIAALSLDAYDGRMEPFTQGVHDVRPYRGQLSTAKAVRDYLTGSQLISQQKEHVQDPYSFRCVPQVHGASKDCIDYVTKIFETEINSATDNPTVLPNDDLVISAGNFHGQPLALALDFLAIGLAELGSISERRTYQLISGKRGLPSFLVAHPGLNSGFMIPQYTSAALVSENKVLAHPSSVDSIPTSANQEDHVSMGGYSARKAVTILENTRKVLAIEMLLSAQALNFSLLGFKPGHGTLAAHECIRGAIPYIRKDEYLYPLVQRAIELAERGSVVGAVEAAIGELD
jgi:histidine ammonia-lyase